MAGSRQELLWTLPLKEGNRTGWDLVSVLSVWEHSSCHHQVAWSHAENQSLWSEELEDGAWNWQSSRMWGDKSYKIWSPRWRLPHLVTSFAQSGSCEYMRETPENPVKKQQQEDWKNWAAVLPTVYCRGNRFSFGSSQLTPCPSQKSTPFRER